MRLEVADLLQQPMKVTQPKSVRTNINELAVSDVLVLRNDLICKL